MLAHVEISWLAPSKLRRTVIVGSEKMLVYEDGTPEPVRIFDSGIEVGDTSDFGEYQLSYRTGDIVSLRVEATEPITAELIDFRDAIATGREPVSDRRMALDVIRTVEAAEASLAAGGDVVRSPPPPSPSGRRPGDPRPLQVGAEPAEEMDARFRTEQAARHTAAAAAAAATLVPELENSTLISAHRSRRDQLTRRLLALGDAAAILFAIALAAFIADQRYEPLELVAWTALTLPVWILLLKVYKLYDRYTTRISHTAVDDLPWLAHSLLVGSLAFWAFTKLAADPAADLPRGGHLRARGADRDPPHPLADEPPRPPGSSAPRPSCSPGRGPQMHTLLGKINQHPEYGLTPIAMLDGLNAAPRGERRSRDRPAGCAPTAPGSSSTSSPRSSSPSA